jgi:hypothetical protein
MDFVFEITVRTHVNILKFSDLADGTECKHCVCVSSVALICAVELVASNIRCLEKLTVTLLGKKLPGFIIQNGGMLTLPRSQETQTCYILFRCSADFTRVLM